jgi:hypothetical protein
MNHTLIKRSRRYILSYPVEWRDILQHYTQFDMKIKEVTALYAPRHRAFYEKKRSDND